MSVTAVEPEINEVVAAITVDGFALVEFHPPFVGYVDGRHPRREWECT